MRAPVFRVVVACSALAGCNQIFGLDKTRPADAPFYDSRPDAPFACPGVGGTPAFQRGLYQELAESCYSYSITATGGVEHAMGLCEGGVVSYGDPRGPLDAVGLPQNGNLMLRQPRLAPDDNQAIITTDDYTVPITRFELYQHQDDGTWQPAGAIATTSFGGGAAPAMISTPTRGTHRHAIMIDYSMKEMFELVEGDGATYPWAAQPLQSFDAAVFYTPGPLSLSPDGLRMVFFANDASNTALGIYYTDRDGLSKPFSPPRWLMDVSHAYNTDPFLTENCSRLYLSGLDSIFYAVQ